MTQIAKSDSVKVVQHYLDYPEVIQQKTNIKVLDTFINLQWLLKHFEAKVRYNLMTRRREITLPAYPIFTDDSENDSLSTIHYIATNNGMPVNNLDMHLDKIAAIYPYHPIVDCIKVKIWDGIPRLDKFIATIKTKDMILSHKIIKTWMIAAIAAAFSQTGFINQGVLVLQGKQNIGKTRWVKSLEPGNFNAVKEGAILDPANKDNVILLARHWIIELGELDATFRKADIARLKSFITMQADDVRFPYAKKETHLVRRSAYIATVNEQNFLADETGNRRWWVIPVEAIEIDQKFDMQQVWAEAQVEWALGGLTYLSSEIQASVNESNQDYEKVDPLKEKLLTYYDWEHPARKSLTASAILEEIGYRQPTRADASRVGNILKEINGKDGRKSNGCKVHEVPTCINLYNKPG